MLSLGLKDLRDVRLEDNPVEFSYNLFGDVMELLDGRDRVGDTLRHLAMLGLDLSGLGARGIGGPGTWLTLKYKRDNNKHKALNGLGARGIGGPGTWLTL